MPSSAVGDYDRRPRRRPAAGDRHDSRRRARMTGIDSVPPATPKTVGVLGGGRMGAGIAQVFAVAGAVVCLAERDPAAAVAARDRVAMGLLRAAEKGKLTES